MDILFCNTRTYKGVRTITGTATTAAYLMSEGYVIGLTDKEMRRAEKAMHRLGLTHPEEEDSFMDGVWDTFADECMGEYTTMLGNQVEEFIEDMMIMGFLTDYSEEECQAQEDIEEFILDVEDYSNQDIAGGWDND